MAKAPRVKPIREIKIDTTKNRTAELIRLKAIGKEPGADPIEKALVIAILGKEELNKS